MGFLWEIEPFCLFRIGKTRGVVLLAYAQFQVQPWVVWGVNCGLGSQGIQKATESHFGPPQLPALFERIQHICPDFSEGETTFEVEAVHYSILTKYKDTISKVEWKFICDRKAAAPPFTGI